ITLQRAGHPLRFNLFPMIHLGAAEFYQAVQARLADCDVIVAEGMASDSALTRALTSTYRASANSERLGLVVQDIDYAALAAKGIRVITPDMRGEHLGRGWTKLPGLEKATIVAVAPSLATALRLFGPRRVLASFLTLDDSSNEDDPSRSDVLPKLDKL